MIKYIVVLIVIGIVLLILLSPRVKVQRKKDKDAREHLAMKITGDRLIHCKAHTPSDSQGTLLDEVLICDITKDLSAVPVVGIEQVTVSSNPSDWQFINIDCTLWDELNNVKPKIMCKTIQCYNIMKKVYKYNDVVYTGFTSIDRYDGSVQKDFNKFLHLAGKSPAKGSVPLVNTWMKHPEWPVLTIICRAGVAKYVNGLIKEDCKNIKMITEYVTEKKLKTMINSHGIHLCVSEYEGFGHNINEARSAACVALYTDGECMNEKFTDRSGIPVECTQTNIVNKYCSRYTITEAGLEKAMATVLSMDSESLRQMGLAARDHFLKDDSQFKERLRSLIIGTNKIPRVINTIWISKDTPYKDVPFPDRYKKYLDSWKKHNPEFEFRYWSGAKILKFIKEKFPQYLDFYRELTPVISKCDFARFAIIAYYGGVYTDMDFFCRKNITPLLGCEQFFAMETMKSNHLFNGFFAACANDPFVLGWLEQMTKNSGGVLNKTGPAGLFKYYKSCTHTVRFGNSCRVVSITDRHKTAKQCKGFYDTYITTTWGDGSDWAGFSKSHNTDADDIQRKFSDATRLTRTVNPIDKSLFLLWEDSKFTYDNWPGLYYDENEKREIFELCKQNKQGYGVIDVGAHIGDLAIPLAQALDNIGRSDIIIYAIDPSRDKCDFIERMALINSLSNITVIHTGLTDVEKVMSANCGVGNTGGCRWTNDSTLSESLQFVTIDSLVNSGKIGPVGLYHIDVEGMEEKVLRGSKDLINMFRPIICLEKWINAEATEKCKTAEQCPELFDLIDYYNYKVAGFLYNKDMILTPKPSTP
jgi:FkbM family methyltransferase